jgi:osmoprotectant transport system permease protein
VEPRRTLHAEKPDRVALVAAAAGLAACLLLPFVDVRANRIVEGTPVRVIAAAGAWGWLLVAVLALGLLAPFAPRPRRGALLLASAVAALASLLAALGAAATTLVPGGDSPARVSVGAGAWLVFAALAAVWFQGNRSASHVQRVAAAALAALAGVAAVVGGGLSQLSLAIEYREQASTFWTLFANHVVLTLSGTAIAAVVGVPLGIAAARRSAVRSVAIPAAGLVQTIPSLALFGLLTIPLAVLGLPTIGTVPALIALTLYALLPIVRNTYLGIASVDIAAVDAGRGMGMTSRELLWRVELPMALPFVLEGLRAALVLTVGIAAVMAIGGAQNLGTLVFLGWGVQAADLVLLGAVPMVLLSVAADQTMRAVERTAVSPGIRMNGGEAA